MDKLIIICGPTGSGKTKLAIDLALKLNTEIISADSLAIYKELDIGTAKPTLEEQSLVKHHLIDVVSPFDNFSVSDYRELALSKIRELISKGKVPIICGGTGFYINSLIYDLSYGNSEGNTEIREKYNKMALEMGNDAVFDVLKQVDPKSAKEIHPNNVKRVIRALEIFYSTGKKKSDQNDTLTPLFDYTAFSIDYPREILYERIDKRVDLMIENGLVDEVKQLIDKGVNLDCQSMQGIGYKETYDAIINSKYDSFIDDIKLNSRHYAKRQITFFKKLPNLNYLQTGYNVDEVLKIYEK